MSEDGAVTDPRTVDTVDVPAALRGVRGLEPGQQLGRYAIGELVGAGGMGEVYRAVDEPLKRTVAIKVMRTVERGRDRLLEEARAMAKLSHPHVVVVHEAGLVDGRVFIAMEYVAGPTLRAWVKDRPWRDVVRMYVAAGRGLAALHAAKLVHRDFKPDNVLVGEDGRPRVADFGLAVVEDAEPEVKGGTPRYMAPEQRDSVAVDVRSDQFAFCVALWEAVTGEPPGDKLAAGAMPAHVRAALARGLATEPGARWPSLDALLAELEHDPAVRRRRIAAGAGVLALAGLAGFALYTRGGDPRSACDAAAARIDQAWTPLDAQLVGTRFAGLPRAHAATTFELVRGELDGYAKGWADLRRDVCLASAVRKEITAHTSELEVACLDRLAGSLRALVTVLEREGDAATLDHAAAAVGALRAPGECSVVQGLDAIPPPSPEQRARVAQLQADHDRVEAEFRAGRYKQMEPLARANAKAADEVGYVPAQAEAAMSLGLLDNVLHDNAAEERDNAQAVTYAGTAHDDHVMNVAWRGLVGAAIARNHFDVAAERLRFAQAALARSGNAPLYEARLESTRATLLLAKGDAAGALAAVDHAVQIADRGNVSPLERAGLLNTRGRVLVQLHRGADAIVAFEGAKQIWESVLGPDEPNIAGVLLNISNAESNLGRYDDAERDLDRSAQMTEAEFGPYALNLGRVLNNRCEVRLRRHDVLGAEKDCERALAIKTKASGPNSAELASTLMTLAELAEQRDDVTAADDLRARILALHVAALGDHHPKVAQDYYDLAAAALHAGDAAKAHDDVERGRAIAEAGHDPTLVAEGQSALADVLRAQGDIAGARAAIRLALAQHEELAKGSANADVAQAVAQDHDLAGQIEQAGGDLAAAERELRRAVELVTPVAGAGKVNLAAPLEHLGVVLAAAGKHHDATDVLGRSLDIAIATAGSRSQLARITLALASARWADGDHPGAVNAAEAAQASAVAAPDSPAIVRLRAAAAAWLAAHH